jgi:hypothetical protein
LCSNLCISKKKKKKRKGKAVKNSKEGILIMRRQGLLHILEKSPHKLLDSTVEEQQTCSVELR